MKAVEPLLVDVCIQQAKMGQQINISKGILMANSLIQKTSWQKKLMRDQQIWKMNKDGDNFGHLGRIYWADFMKKTGTR